MQVTPILSGAGCFTMPSPPAPRMSLGELVLHLQKPDPARYLREAIYLADGFRHAIMHADTLEVRTLALAMSARIMAHCDSALAAMGEHRITLHIVDEEQEGVFA